MLIGLLIVLAVSCTDNDDIDRQPTVKTHALLVGVENSLFVGPSPGSMLDVKTFAAICQTKRIKTTKLINSAATVAAVRSNLIEICNNNDLAIFYYSGHGGQTAAFDPYNQHEGDGKDEFLCLYDKALLDDDIWQIISNARGRVVCIFDACHSETMYRAPMFTDKVIFGAPMYTNFVDAVNVGGIFVLSGSPEDAYSYGSAVGGRLTNAIKRHYNKRSYLRLFDKLEKDKQLRSLQQPMCTIINGFDANVEFLR